MRLDGGLAVGRFGESGDLPASEGAGGRASTRAVIDRHCVGCDSDKVKAGGLVLSTLDPGNPGDRPDVWEKVVR